MLDPTARCGGGSGMRHASPTSWASRAICGRLLSAPSLRVESEGRVLVGDEDECVADDAVGPAEDTEDEVEEAARVAAGEQDREPGDHDRDEGCDPEEGEQDVVGDREQPLHERQPTA